MARLEATKRCTKCGEPKMLSAFHRNAKAPDGRHVWCSTCRQASARARRIAGGAVPRYPAVVQPNHPLTQDAWLSGFIDGEGCFILDPQANGVVPRFLMGLRADDAAILDEARRALGGRLNWTDQHAPGLNAHLRCTWGVSSKVDLMRLVDYLERFPLRAKKSRDCLIWCHGVRLYVAHGRHASELPALAAELQGIRTYDPVPARRLRVVGGDDVSLA